jgi:hypothetical protein
MPFFKKKQERTGRIEELEAHVRNIRRIAAEDPKGAGALQSFLIEDGYWDSAAAALQAQHAPEAAAKPPPPVQRQAPPSPPAPAEAAATPAPSSEDEAMLEAELQRYLARMAGESASDDDADAEDSE